MNIRCLLLLVALLGLAALTAGAVPVQTQDQPPPLPTLPEGVDVQARGPVHEAYAEPMAPRPDASPVVPKQPPNPIDEMPPDQKPDGNDVRWVPGYWAWDDGGNDFLWVSGCWRNNPPGKLWVAGHWQEVEGGSQWAPGFWTDAQQQQVDYLPPPPPSIDNGPAVPAPDDSSVYVPGCWVYKETRYLWRPGFWTAFHPEWAYIPAHYVWSPGGCVFIEGYWDHPLGERGLLFAPVRLARALLTQQGWAYTPQYVVQPDFLIGALFVRPANHCYYFGDYFEDRYAQRGFVPWVDYRITRNTYDPNFSYYRQTFAREKAWETNLRELYAGRRRGDIPRPPTTLVQQTKTINNFTVNKVQNVTVNKTINITNVQNVSVLAPLTQIHNTRVTALASLAGGKAVNNPPIARNVIKMAPVAPQERVQERKMASQIREVASQRKQVEAKLLASGSRPIQHTDPARPVKIDLPKLVPPRPAVQPPPPQQVRKAPPPLTLPQHVEQPIPKHEPIRPSLPPKKVTPPPAPPKQGTPPGPQALVKHVAPPVNHTPPAPPHSPAAHPTVPPAPPHLAVVHPAPPPPHTPPAPPHVPTAPPPPHAASVHPPPHKS